MGYSIYNETVPEATQEETPEYWQIDAPAGSFVTGAYTSDVSDPTVWAHGELITDGQDRVTGVMFSRNPNRDMEGYLVCDGPDPSGSVTLTAGVGVVSFPALTASSRVFVERRTAGGTTAGNVYNVTARSPGTGFTISAVILATGLTGILDTSTVDWVVIV